MRQHHFVRWEVLCAITGKQLTNSQWNQLGEVRSDSIVTVAKKAPED